MRTPDTERHCPCGTRLAWDNRDHLCRACRHRARTLRATPPRLPTDFWQHPDLRQALACEDMGQVIHAYRTHPWHNTPLSQEIVAGWMDITQARLSRIENGDLIENLRKLRQWAHTLSIPADLLWFTMPGAPSPSAGGPDKHDVPAPPQPHRRDDVRLPVVINGRPVLVPLDPDTAASSLGIFLDELVATYAGTGGPVNSTGLDADVLLVRIPQGGVTVSLSRRKILAALGIGSLNGPLLATLDQALGDVRPTPETIAELEQTFNGLRADSQTMAPTQTIDRLTAQVAVIGALRRRAPQEIEHDLTALQARYAELASWMCEEAGDADRALYWIDRTAHWAQLIGWTPMVAYSFARRADMALSHANDGLRAVENAQHALRIPGAGPQVRGLAARNMARSFALAQRPEDSARAVDQAMDLLATADANDDEARIFSHIIANNDLFVFSKATCEVYLGRGESVIPTLAPHLESIPKTALRYHAIISARVAHAYANAGQPETACRVALDTLQTADTIGSLWAKRELQRTLSALSPWDQRSDVQEVRHKLNQVPYSL